MRSDLARPSRTIAQRFESHKHLLAAAEGIHPSAGAPPKTESSGQALGEVTVKPNIEEVTMTAHLCTSEGQCCSSYDIKQQLSCC